MLNGRIIGRLSTYRRLLTIASASGTARVYSHELAKMSGCTAAQVRRDIMTIGYQGSPAKGYEVAGLISKISEVLDTPEGQNFALVGVGHLGQAIMAYFPGRSPHLKIAAAFDTDSDKCGRVLHGCRCYHIDQLERTVRDERIAMAIVAVPAIVAQDIADRLVAVGVRGILNFAPVRLRTPADTYVENVDITESLEKVAFFARSETSASK